MHIRDREIERLVKYAEGLGLRVEWKRHRRGDPGATWDMDGSVIEVFTWPSQSKTTIILNIVHELAHHMAWIYAQRKKDEAVDAAIIADNESSAEEPPPKAQRKLIYLSEKNDTKYRPKIMHEVGIKLPKYKVAADKALDIWCYRHYYKKGNYPGVGALRAKQRELRAKYRRKFGTKDVVEGL